jgi:glycosyltransferase involved in cell wall biosynthesis
MTNLVPLLSIVIPTYNRRHLLEKTLKSVFLELPQCYEVIVVDDGSTDETIEILKSKYSMNVNFCILQQQNSGPAAARNYGVSQARGEWIAFLDSDDLWLPWTSSLLANLVSEMSETSKAKAIFLQTRGFTDEIDVDEWLSERRKIIKHPSMLDLRLNAPMSMLGACNFVIRREEFNRVGAFSTDTICGEDTDLFYRLGNVGEAWSVINPVMLAYRTSNSDSLTHRDHNLMIATNYILRRYRRGFYPNPMKKSSKAIHKTLSFAIRGFFSKGCICYAYIVYLKSIPVFIEAHDFKNLIRFPLTPILHYIHPHNYSFRWRRSK